MTTRRASPEYLWFLDTLVSVRIAAHEGADGLSILEHRARWRDSPPLHIHRTEDEIFHILEGEFRFQVQDEQFTLGAGATVLAPRGTPHTYRVESPDGGRWLTITARGDFERFVRALGRPADRHELPPASGPPSEEGIAALARTADAHEIELVGPPLR